MLINKKNLLSILNFNLIILNYNKKINLLYIYNSKYYIIITDSLFKKYIYYNKQISCIYFNNYLFFNYFFNKIINNFQKLNFRFLFFKGRGFRYRVNKNNFLLLLGYSHLLYLNISNLFFKIISKTSILFFNFSSTLNLNNILKFRKLNIFTSKGLTSNKLNIFKKTGKVSFYI